MFVPLVTILKRGYVFKTPAPPKPLYHILNVLPISKLVWIDAQCVIIISVRNVLDLAEVLSGLPLRFCLKADVGVPDNSSSSQRLSRNSAKVGEV